MKFFSLESDKGYINGFDKCEANVEIPPYARVIGPSLFMEEEVLQSVEMPVGVETIESQAFFGCINLSRVPIPDSVTSIKSQAFIYCFSLKNVTLPQYLHTLGTEVFMSCTSLERIVIPNSIKTIAIRTFYACENLKEAILPNGLTSIECEAFANCKSLKEITIPPSVTDIDELAFENNRGLTIRGEVGSYAEKFAHSANLAFVSMSEETTLVRKTTSNFLVANPFYILGVPCCADRKAIVSAAEEMSFSIDANLCDEAQSTLLNPSKRLNAELNWFISEPEETIEEISDCIKMCRPISTDLPLLSALNAEIHNFSIATYEDVFELGYDILSLDYLYNRINLDIVYTEHCEIRTKGNQPIVSRNDIERELNSKRALIRQVIIEKLSSLIWSDYTLLVSIIAEKCIADPEYNDGILLSDILDAYEIEISDEVEYAAKDFMRTEESIKSLTPGHTENIKQEVEFLISQVKNWDKKVQPLQLRAMASGMPHKLSENVGYSMRSIALHLNNELNDAENALLLVQAMQTIFAEIKSLADLFSKDAAALKDILKSANERDEINKEIEAVKKHMYGLYSGPNEAKVDSLVTMIKALDAKILACELSDEEKQIIRENVCCIVRECAVELHNVNKETAIALSITNALIRIYGNIPSVNEKLRKDASTLNQQLLIQNRIKAAEKKQEDANAIKGIIVVALVIFFLVAIVMGLKDSPSDSSSKNDVPEVVYSSSLDSGTDVYTDIVSIFPSVGIYNLGSSYYTHFVCECRTSSGSKVWIYMTTSEYQRNFDSTASTFVSDYYFADEITFASRRVYGTVQTASSIMSSLPSRINTTKVINFSSVED